MKPASDTKYAKMSDNGINNPMTSSRMDCNCGAGVSCDCDSKREESVKTYNTFHNGARFKDDQNNCQKRKSPDIANGGGVSHSAGPEYTLQEALDGMGFGWYQIRISLLFGLYLMADSMEIMLLSVLSPVLKCTFHISPAEESLLTIVVFAGMMVGGCFWGKIGDVFGRRRSLLMSSAVCSYFGLLTALSPTYWWVVLNRFLVALGLGGFLQLYTLYAELIPTKSRSYCLVLLGMVWALGSVVEVLLAMVSLLSLNWRWLLVFTAVPSTACVCLFRVFPMSPRYLMTQGKHEEVTNILEKISRVNGKPLPEGQLCQITDKDTNGKGRIRDLFCPRYLRTTLLLSVVMAAINMAYYGTALLTTALFDKNDGCHGYDSSSSHDHSDTCRSHCTSLDLDDYVDLFLTALGDAPGMLLCVGVMALISRKASLALQMAVYGVLMAACDICSSRQVLVALLFCARAMGAGGTEGILVYVAEVYPTSIRATGMGYCTVVKSFGVIVAALLSSVLVEYSAFLAITSYAAVGFIGAIAMWLMPYETKDRTLEDTIEENVSFEIDIPKPTESDH